ncbi:DNA gyrase/topoisomerase IV subunit B [Enterococcus sp. PF1-24]|uniref:hypothetical protein n=1 Tax=unclassified Enterococcus TaxID=2608891 RepID=UPI00247555A2|nr:MULTISPECIES: hypothetical protein [unclassified Enterococcus]MDH6365216.1 DNA gyrase/topoisomerase IV subunit B [Enterococcus sp. PFB1-1]MDH6402317.1 DNA gyrase/topoisomerase IV subunit B [Enterococcus sp. PF1-24]
MLKPLWDTLNDQKLDGNIKERPAMFLGTRGYEGLQSMIFTGIKSLIQSSKNLGKSQLQINLEEGQIALVFTLGAGNSLADWQQNQQVISFINLAVMKTLSTNFLIEIQFSNQIVSQEFKQDKMIAEVTRETSVDAEEIRIIFTPDYRFFGLKTLPYFLYYDFCQHLAMLNSDFSITLSEKDKQQNSFCYSNGLEIYLHKYDNYLSRKGNPAYFKGKIEQLEIEILISRNDQGQVMASFANSEPTYLGGAHLEGFFDGAIPAFNQFLEEQNNLAYYDREMFCDRFDVIVSVKLANPKYNGSTKQKLRNPEVYNIVKDFIHGEFLTFLRSYTMWYRG